MDGKPLALLTQEELLGEISSNLPELISNPDFILEFKLRVLGLSPDSRREFIEQTLKALEGNNQSLGAFLVTRSGTRLPPTVSNWLKDFSQYVGSPADKAKREEYLNRPDFKKIELGARTILNNLFEFYELLMNYQRQPDQISRTVVKDESGKVKIIDKGEFLDFETEKPSEEEEKESPPEQREITEERAVEEKHEEKKGEIIEEKELAEPPALREEIFKEEIIPTEDVSKEKIAEAEKIEEPTDQTAPVKAIAASYLHPDDEEEIRSHQNNLSAFSLPELSGPEGLIKTLIEKNNLSFPDDILEKRFTSIASSFLKGIRNKRETLDLFTRPLNEGGLEYSNNLAQKLLEELEENENMIYAQKVITPAKPRSVPTPQEALEKTLAEKEILKPAPAEETPAFISGQQYDIPEPIKTYPAEKKEEKEKGFSAPEKIEREEKFKVKRPLFSGRPRMDDIKGKAKITGPIDELRNMNLNDFHRLETEKTSSVEKIYDKINLLKEESFAKYAEGIKAWRDSEIYSIYLEMGSESMEVQKSIREIIEGRKAANQPYLTVKEFNEIADLNQKLRY